MTWEILIYMLLVTTAISSGIGEALQDVITNRHVFGSSLLRFPFLASNFWDTYKSWLNKYATTERPGKHYWYYFGLYKPTYPEAFPFSTTLLVGITDGFHFVKWLQSIHNLHWAISIIVLTPHWVFSGFNYHIVLLFFIGWILPMITFHIFYRYFTWKKK